MVPFFIAYGFAVDAGEAFTCVWVNVPGTFSDRGGGEVSDDGELLKSTSLPAASPFNLWWLSLLSSARDLP